LQAEKISLPLPLVSPDMLDEELSKLDQKEKSKKKRKDEEEKKKATAGW
jgi:hypothetical protein